LNLTIISWVLHLNSGPIIALLIDRWGCVPRWLYSYMKSLMKLATLPSCWELDLTGGRLRDGR